MHSFNTCCVSLLACRRFTSSACLPYLPHVRIVEAEAEEARLAVEMERVKAAEYRTTMEIEVRVAVMSDTTPVWGRLLLAHCFEFIPRFWCRPALLPEDNFAEEYM